MDYNCTSLYFANITPPNVRQQLEAFGNFGILVSIGGSISTVLLIVLFILNLTHFIRTSPPRARRLLTWITSLPMVISFVALMTFVIPRSGDFCDTVKQVYLPFIMMHFVDLTLTLEGGQSAALQDLVEQNQPLILCKPPCCCFGICFRHLHFNKHRLRFIKGLVYQTPLIQLALIVVTLLLQYAEVMPKKKTQDGLFLFLSILTIVCFLFGMWGYNIIATAFANQLKRYHYAYKARLLVAFIVLQKKQNFILIILYVCNVIPCIPPDVSKTVVRKSIDASLTLLESLIFGILFYLDYRKMHFIKEVHSKVLHVPEM